MRLRLRAELAQGGGLVRLAVIPDAILRRVAIHDQRRIDDDGHRHARLPRQVRKALQQDGRATICEAGHQEVAGDHEGRRFRPNRRHHGVGGGQSQGLTVRTDAGDGERTVVGQVAVRAGRAGQLDGLAGGEPVGRPASAAPRNRVARGVAGEHDAREAELARDRDLLAHRIGGVAGVRAVPGATAATSQAVGGAGRIAGDRCRIGEAAIDGLSGAIDVDGVAADPNDRDLVDRRGKCREVRTL